MNFTLFCFSWKNNKKKKLSMCVAGCFFQDLLASFCCSQLRPELGKKSENCCQSVLHGNFNMLIINIWSLITFTETPLKWSSALKHQSVCCLISSVRPAHMRFVKVKEFHKKKNSKQMFTECFFNCLAGPSLWFCEMGFNQRVILRLWICCPKNVYTTV